MGKSQIQALEEAEAKAAETLGALRAAIKEARKVDLLLLQHAETVKAYAEANVAKEVQGVVNSHKEILLDQVDKVRDALAHQLSVELRAGIDDAREKAIRQIIGESRGYEITPAGRRTRP